MTGEYCERMRDLLPDWRAGRLDPTRVGEVERHLETCESCKDEVSLIDALLSARPAPPPDLAQRIQARVRGEMAVSRDGVVPLHSGSHRSRSHRTFSSLPRLTRWTPAWALSAAAVAALALGLGVFGGPETPEIDQDAIVVASQEPLPEAWLWDDGMVAGGPVFDDLTDEELEALIKEYEG